MPFDAALSRFALASLLLICSFLTGCDSYRVPGVYRIDIQQGNVITQEMLAQIKPGITREKVRFILGTPLIEDVFHEDRWDYVYLFDGADGRERRKLTLHFKGEELLRAEGKAAPDGEDTPSAQSRVVSVPEKEKPWWQNLFGGDSADDVAEDAQTRTKDAGQVTPESVTSEDATTPGEKPGDDASSSDTRANALPKPATGADQTGGDAAVAESVLAAARAKAAPVAPETAAAAPEISKPSDAERAEAVPAGISPVVIPTTPGDQTGVEREEKVPADTPSTGAISIPL